jgi:hypothetical protein
MKLKVLNPFIDLLLACCMALLEDETQSPVIRVSNIPELAEALIQDGIMISGTRVPSDNRRSVLEREGVAPLGLDHTLGSPRPYGLG